jgi:signal transduction histidine kinase
MTDDPRLDDILAVVSHDLRGPLHSITLAVEALRDEVSADGLRYLAAIERASLRAEKLIADLLEAHAIENGRLELHRSKQDAVALATQAATEHELLAREAKASIEVVPPSEALTVHVDRERVMQVFANLLGNCFKHAKGAPITIELARGDGQCVFSVHDCGPGITADELPHVFDRYWSGRKTRGGAGIGLSIAKGIVAAHGGTIEAVAGASPGAGATMRFTLPLA